LRAEGWTVDGLHGRICGEDRNANLQVCGYGAAVMKKFVLQMGLVILRSANSQYPDMEIMETDQFQIAGVVLRIVDGVL
jgi:phage repressor protein C with HTH and peptisase S24 domain